MRRMLRTSTIARLIAFVAIFVCAAALATGAQAQCVSICAGGGGNGGNGTGGGGTGGANGPTGPTADIPSIYTSVNNIGDQHFSQMVTNRILAGVLLGANEQVNCSDCVSAFGSAGSFSAGVHGRKNITEQLSILGGAAYSEYDAHGFNVRSAPILAIALRYDFTNWGSSRPFVDVGAVISPGQRISYERGYLSSVGLTTATGDTHGADYAVFERLGWVMRLTPIDEFALAGELWEGWQRTGDYQETPTAANPFNATVSGGTDRMNIFRVGGQWTHLIGNRLELNISAGYAQSFGTSLGVSTLITGVGFVAPSIGEQHWGEYGARLGWRLTKDIVADVFVNGTFGPAPIGNTAHGGVGLRFHF